MCHPKRHTCTLSPPSCSPSSSPHHVALNSRASGLRLHTNATCLGPAKQPDPLADNSELLDIVLLASVDGKFHALKPHHRPYSLVHVVVLLLLLKHSCFAALVAPAAGPHAPHRPGPGSHRQLLGCVPGDVHHRAAVGGHICRGDTFQPAPALPVLHVLIDMSPFSFATADDHRVFVGRKATVEVVVELETGEVQFGGPGTCPWGGLDERDGREPPPKRREVVVGRTDYHVTIHTRPSDKRNRVPAQTLAFSTYGPSGRDNVLQTSYHSTEDGVYMQSLPNGEIISFKARGESEDHSVLWGCKFKSPIVAIFDVLQDPTHNTFVLLQPRPQLSAILPKLAQNPPMDQLPHLGSAYIGLVEETGSLFAMSADRFPLVAFTGGRKRRENAMKPRSHRSEDEKCLGRPSLYTDRRLPCRDAPARGLG
ncbi:hypothetical protein B0H14DRAFT_2617658 [Mycena olivaceomarginata]|nr:hypothetical protein B0H14DRAFT_2617658 [Mycena olivaceomarginata]